MSDKLALLHPLLFSIIFVIMPYTQYAGLIPPAQVVVSFIVICVFALFSYLIIKRIVKKRGVAVAVLSPLLIIFFNYGTLYEHITELTQGTKLDVPVLILATLFILIILVVYIVKILRAHEGTQKSVNKAFCVIAVTLIIFNTFSITMQSIMTAKIIESSGMTGIPLQKNTGPLPDIYFVILDEWAAPSQMKSYFHYDISPFVEHLRQKGFMVTEMSLITESLGSFDIMEHRLNMEATNRKDVATVSSSLLDRLLQSMSLLNTSQKENMTHLRNSKVIVYLKSLGYQFIYMGNWAPPLRYNRLADQNINCFGFQFTDELSYIIVNSSVLRLVTIHRYFHRKGVLDAFANLGNMPVVAGKPKFIYAHILCPHVPYIFGAKGEKLALKPGGSKEADKQLYLNQHIFITKKAKELVDQKLSNSQAAPVIIIQADHGARMDKPGAHQVFSAVYIPSYKGRPWQDSISSSNTFRLLFNELFGSNLEILQ